MGAGRDRDGAETAEPAPVPGGARLRAGPLVALQRTVGNRVVTATVLGPPAPPATDAEPVPVQRFPFEVVSRTPPMRLVARISGPDIVLHRNGIFVGYLRISRTGTVWALKHILVDNNVVPRGAGLGTLLVYFFAALARGNGATALEVLLPNGVGLYQRTGFVVVPNPHGPATITGVPATVENAARAALAGAFEIGPVVPAVPAPAPPAAIAKKRQLINDNQYGNPAIGDDAL